MNISNIRERLMASTVIGGVALAAFAAAPAVAQEAQDDDATTVQELVITGSRIVRSDITSASPITIKTGEDIRESGITDIGQVLRQDPAIGSGGFNQSNVLSGGGASSIDLRNLGAARTLTLINGRRYANYTDALQNRAMDLGLLPNGFIERVEVLRDGAGPTYGSDAVAGVVNFILRQDFNGFEVNGSYGMSDEGDANQYNISTVMGSSWDRASITFGVDFSVRSRLQQTERDWALNPIASPTGAIGSGAAPGARLIQPGGPIIQCYGNEGGRLGTTGCPTYDYGLQQSLIGGQERISIAGHATYDLTDDIEFYTTFIYANRDSQFDLAANPMFANSPTGPYPAGIVVPGTSASNPFGVDVGLQWRPAQYAARENNYTATQLWGSFGVTGRLMDRFNWDLSHTYGRTQSRSSTAGTPWATHLQTILVTDECNADPVCTTVGAIPNIDDFFAGDYVLTPDQFDYVFYTAQTSSNFISRQTQANITGDLFELPAGMLAFALGAEYRSEFGEAIPDPVAAAGESLANGTSPTSGSFNTREVYGELEVPLLAGLPLVEMLTLNLQARYSDFSNFGGADTYKVGLNWAITPDVRMRASWGTSYRAPDIGNLYGGGIQSFSSINDPCTNFDNQGAGTYDPVVEQNCAALGAPAGFTQSAPQIRVLAGGNPNLTPEEGENYTVGFVLTPRFAPDFAFAIDYYELELENAIGGGSLATFLAECYRDPNFLTLRNDPNSDCFGLDARTPSFDLATLPNRAQNLSGITERAGVDWSLGYVFRGLGGGDLNVNWANSHITDALYVGTIYTPSGIAEPEWRSTLSLNYVMDNWSLGWSTRYTSAMTDTLVDINDNPNYYSFGYTGTDDYFINDVRFRYEMDSMDFVVGVNNVFDEDPPYAFETGSNTNSALYDVIGRYVFVQIGKRF